MAEIGIHIKDRVITIEEIVAADITVGMHRNNHHKHKDAYELIYVVEGHAVVQIDDVWTDMNAGNCVLIPRNTPHDSLTETESTRALYFAFVCNDDLSFLERQFVHITSEDRGVPESIINQLQKGFIDVAGQHNVYTLVPTKESPFGMEQLAIDYLEMLLLISARIVKSNAETIQNITHIQKAQSIAEDATSYIANQITEYINKHYKDNLTVGSIAEHFDYSRSRISVIYKKETGKGINEAINEAKMQMARNLLIESDMSVSEISDYLGFSSPQYFTNRFVINTGMSPSNYAKFKRTKVN